MLHRVSYKDKEKNYNVFLTHSHILNIHKYLPMLGADISILIHQSNKSKYKISKKHTSQVKVNMLQNSSKPSKGIEALQNYQFGYMSK